MSAGVITCLVVVPIALIVVDILFDGVLRFWERRTRLGYLFLWQRFCIWKIERRIRMDNETSELTDMIRQNQDRLARLAMKHPHAFLGVARNPGGAHMP